MKRDMSGYRTRILEDVREALEALDLEQVETALEEIINAEHVFCDGLGRSGLSMRGFAMRLGQMGKKGVLVGEATAPAFGSGDLLVICTASGTSPVLLHHAKQARRYGGRILLITGNAHSGLSELSDALILIQAPDKDQGGEARASVQPMGSLFEQVSALVCDLMAVTFMNRQGLTSDEMRKYHANIE